MSGYTTYGDVSPRVGIFAVAKALATAEPQLCLDKFALNTPVPTNKGETVKWRRPVVFNVSTSTLTEGVTPSAQSFDVVDVTTNLSQYGQITRLTDKIQDLHEDPVLNWVSEEMGKQAATTKEMLLWNTLKAASTIFYSDGSAESSVATPLDIGMIRAGINQLKRSHAKRVSKRISATTGVGTEPVNEAYILVGHTDNEPDIRGLAGFLPVESYGSFAPIHPNELGKIEDCRIILTPHLVPEVSAGAAAASMRSVNGTAGTACDVYRSVMFGQDAYGTCALKGKDSAQMAVTNPKMGTPGDELGQRGSVSWKFWHADAILNDAWIVALYAACTAL